MKIDEFLISFVIFYSFLTREWNHFLCLLCVLCVVLCVGSGKENKNKRRAKKTTTNKSVFQSRVFIEGRVEQFQATTNNKQQQTTNNNKRT